MLPKFRSITKLSGAPVVTYSNPDIIKAPYGGVLGLIKDKKRLILVLNYALLKYF